MACTNAPLIGALPRTHVHTSLGAAIAGGGGPQPNEWDAMAVQAAVVDSVRILDILCRTDAAIVSRGNRLKGCERQNAG